MTYSAHASHDAVLRARVALLGSQTLPARQEVAAYRVLVQVSPLAYLPLLAEALYEYSRQDFAHLPETALALRAEAVAAARRMYTMEPSRDLLLIKALDRYREQLVLMDRKEELGSVEREMALVAAGGGV
ncbi:hypothetical protein [Streptomyces nojiriensis]|uniref:Uncharacterized protein n=1 Tax=Streptomyces nojiriensis TaxID=66374 RepID=A0ABQ3SK59_9ACTN|nr:hypothetical protein [Streptomyces nojiriensis]QTI50125.1 hypothetical protein JYK04_08001 [Streptomyces nojiriensis]GGS23012.1 hypothetical protein GCM10010205_61230 [Streptomyces nojiriensis]GHI68528.1 hypothetical protein Snoj_24460 [Streptomyces nojiriensis]